MSAVAGIWRNGGSPECASECRRMLDSLALYGRDRRASLTAGDLSLGCCLTRILPEDAFDQQPVIAAGGRVVVADLRLDNRDELVSALGFTSEWARRAADVAILAASLDRWGIEATDRLAGEYAFAVWDPRSSVLILARDPLGQRPLCFHQGRGFFAFASMPSGLHALPDVSCAPDMEQIMRMLALVPFAGRRTFFDKIERVEPGHYVVVTPEGITSRRHWNPQRRTLRLKQPADYAEALREVLDTSVRSCLRGAGDVATHLSGGLDSSTVTVTAARLQEGRGHRVAAFTSAPRAEGGNAVRKRFGDETGHASATAALYPNIDHVILRNDRVSPLRELDRNLVLYQKPLLNLCNTLWLHAIGDAVQSRGIRILLTGAFGNAALSYTGRELFPELFWSGSLGSWWREAAAFSASGHGSWRSVAASTFGPKLPDRCWRLIMRRELRDSCSPLHTSIRADQDRCFVRLRKLHERRPADSWSFRLKLLQKPDPGNGNKGMLARDGIEQRDPTADRRLVEFCLSVPAEQYQRGGIPRSLLRRAMAGRLPPLILEERRKGLQAADWHEGLTAHRGEIEAELERLAACEAVANVLDIDRFQRATAAWPASGWEQRSQIETYRSALLRGISAGHFVRSVLASQTPQRTSHAVTA